MDHDRARQALEVVQFVIAAIHTIRNGQFVTGDGAHGRVESTLEPKTPGPTRASHRDDANTTTKRLEDVMGVGAYAPSSATASHAPAIYAESTYSYYPADLLIVWPPAAPTGGRHDTGMRQQRPALGSAGLQSVRGDPVAGARRGVSTSGERCRYRAARCAGCVAMLALEAGRTVSAVSAWMDALWGEQEVQQCERGAGRRVQTATRAGPSGEANRITTEPAGYGSTSTAMMSRPALRRPRRAGRRNRGDPASVAELLGVGSSSGVGLHSQACPIRSGRTPCGLAWTSCEGRRSTI